MKKHLSTIFLFVILLIGLSLMLYPLFADWWNSTRQSKAIASYAEQVATLDEEKYQELWDEAWAYNQSLLERPNDFLLTDAQMEQYEMMLNVGGNGVMGYIEIPTINVVIPVYHGTNEAVLQIAIGHLEWSSLPVGGESSHCVVSGHRGLPSARLFTDLDQMVIGDVFMFRILDEVLTYEVDQIRIVEPRELNDLLIVEGEDYCTLVTCTPYGINSHRLLVRGHRIANLPESRTVHITADAVQIEPLIVAPVVSIPILLLLFIMLMFPKPKKKRRM